MDDVEATEERTPIPDLVDAILADRPLSTGAALKAIALLGMWDDIEARHEYADKILLALIDDPQIARAFDALPKWYS